MPIYLGSQELKPYRGSQEVSEMYLGDVLVYQNAKDMHLWDGSAIYTGFTWEILHKSTESDACICDIQSNYMRLTAPRNGVKRALTPKINMTPYSKLTIRWYAQASWANFVGATSLSNTGGQNGDTLFDGAWDGTGSHTAIGSTSNPRVSELDVSALSGEYWVARYTAGAPSQGWTGQIRIYDIMLEK